MRAVWCLRWYVQKYDFV